MKMLDFPNKLKSVENEKSAKDVMATLEETGIIKRVGDKTAINMAIVAEWLETGKIKGKKLPKKQSDAVKGFLFAEFLKRLFSENASLLTDEYLAVFATRLSDEGKIKKFEKEIVHTVTLVIYLLLDSAVNELKDKQGEKRK